MRSDSAGNDQRPLLTGDEIRQLDAIFLRHSRRLERARAREPLAAALHRTKLPPLLSESLAALLLATLGATVVRGGACSDLSLSYSPTRRRRVEVKGTGLSSWTVLTEKDIAASNLVWIDYSERLADGIAPVDVSIIDLARASQLGAGKLVLARALPTLPRGSVVRYRISLPAFTIERGHPATHTVGRTVRAATCQPNGPAAPATRGAS